MSKLLLDNGFKVALKLHPSESMSDWIKFKQLSYSNFTIYSGSHDFSHLANRSKIFIPANLLSTSVFEAFEMGTLVLLVHYDGVKNEFIC